MNKIHVDPSTYNDINNSLFNLKSPSSVVLNNHNLFNTTEFSIKSKILKAKILNINNKNILDVVFSHNNDTNYNLWKCKLLVDNNIHNKIIKSVINPIINTNIKIKPYKFIDNNRTLLIDIYNDYNNPSDDNLLSSKIIESNIIIINNIKKNSNFYKINNYIYKIMVDTINYLSSKYDDCMLDYLTEESINRILKKN